MDLIKLRNLYAKELFEYCLPFWLKYGVDSKQGGLYSCLDRYGNIYSTDKSVWMQGRCAYVFSRLCNIYGKREEWLKLAENCLRFLDDYCIDKLDGRMYFTVTEDGKPLRKRRYFFSETFYIIANAEYYKATGDSAALQKALSYFDLVYGIYRNPPCDPYRITPKTIVETRSLKSLANPMILLNVNNAMRSCAPDKAKYDKISAELIKDILKFKRPDSTLLLENIGQNGEYDGSVSAYRIVNPGHSIELSWFLLDEAEYYEDNGLRKTAEDIFNAAYKFGWDDKYGGLFYFRDIEGKPVEAYEHDMKLWWPHAEALIATVKLYKVTKNQKYYNIFEKLTDYTFAHFSDREYGEWFGYLRRDGLPTEPPCKGHTYKGPFHVPRMLYTVEQTLSAIIEENNIK